MTANPPPRLADEFHCFVERFRANAAIGCQADHATELGLIQDEFTDKIRALESELNSLRPLPTIADDMGLPNIYEVVKELRAKNQELEVIIDSFNHLLKECRDGDHFKQIMDLHLDVAHLKSERELGLLSPWTSVSERLPTWEELPKNDKDQAMFMVLQNIPESYGYYDAHIKITLYCEKKSWFNLASIYFPQMVERGITHWMAFPIPSPDDTNTQEV